MLSIFVASWLIKNTRLNVTSKKAISLTIYNPPFAVNQSSLLMANTTIKCSAVITKPEMINETYSSRYIFIFGYEEHAILSEISFFRKIIKIGVSVLIKITRKR